MELLVLLLIIFLIAAAVGGIGRGRGFYRRPARPVYDDEVVYDEPVPRRRRFF